jgi:hypothetical protein
MARKYSPAKLKLAKDWAQGDVTHAYVQRKLKKSSVGTYVALALMLREVVKNIK